MKSIPLTQALLTAMDSAAKELRNAAYKLEEAKEHSLDNSVGECVREAAEVKHYDASIFEDIIKRYELK